MPVDKKVRNALRLKNLDLPPGPRVLAVEVEDYVNWEGEDALRVWVTIAEDTTDEELLDGRSGLRLTGAIHDSLLKHGVTLFPYIRVRKPSERLADQEEE
jgi:hypothetical protein